jgi:hypothetical protein
MLATFQQPITAANNKGAVARVISSITTNAYQLLLTQRAQQLRRQRWQYAKARARLPTIKLRTAACLKIHAWDVMALTDVTVSRATQSVALGIMHGEDQNETIGRTRIHSTIIQEC